MSILARSLITGLTLLGLAAFWLFSVGPYRRLDVAGEAIPRALPPVLGPFEAEPAITDQNQWRRRRATLLDAFERDTYGRLPAARPARIVSVSPISPQDIGGLRGAEQTEIALRGGGRFNLVLVVPNARVPTPVIILQNYCGNRAAFPERPEAIATPLHYYPFNCHSGFFRPIHQLIFGPWIDGPPFERITRRGYAVAIFYGGDLVPDRRADAEAALAGMDRRDTGAIAAWAWMYSRIIDVLSADRRLDPHRMIAWGQSRYGKAALLAGAADERIFAVVALQSGRGGDALTRHRAGESVGAITQAFPYWFSPRFRTFIERDPPIDQHQLLALIAPRPLLLGYARRDGWADPAGAIAALRGAEPVYDLLHAPRPQFFMRDGRHGVTTQDWDETLDFLDRVALPR
ncbi:MAG: hypothetical protein HY054_11715 [Proteobacteria bacterium]|nr:hypothetical protein [Pseudomonadota bacterium]